MDELEKFKRRVKALKEQNAPTCNFSVDFLDEVVKQIDTLSKPSKVYVIPDVDFDGGSFK